MAREKDYINFIVRNKDEIKDYLLKISLTAYNYVDNNKESEFILFYKVITHSDILTSCKATKKNSLEDNLLYYINSKEMAEIEKRLNKEFQTAHQSNIGLNNSFYKETGLPNSREYTDKENNHQYLINDFCDVFVINDCLKYFSTNYTKIVFDKLDKKYDRKKWSEENYNFKYDINKGFTPIDLHIAVHGLGMTIDEEFYKIRHHLFKNDTFIILFEKRNDGKNNMFLLFEKNPVFFSIIGEINKNYEEYQIKIQESIIYDLTGKENAVEINDLDKEVTRKKQNEWRKMLYKEMSVYTSTEGEVFCPFTYIQCNFDELGTLFVASHIKAFSDPKTTNKEKYDINNGLLLSSNADALFDKHLISINQNKELVFSFYLEKNQKLKQQLLLMSPIFTPILNNNRMEYLKYHYEIFLKEEEKRKRN